MRLPTQPINLGLLIAIASTLVAAETTGPGQPPIYDSHNQPSPHVFDWNDSYESVSIWDASDVRVNGGFIGGLYTANRASGTITDGQIGGVYASDSSSLLILGISTEYISSRDNATIDLYGCRQSGKGQVLAGGDSVLRIFGGFYDRVYSWFEKGRIIVAGTASLQSLSANAAGIVIQNGGQVQEFMAANTGTSVLNNGVVFGDMVAIENSTLVIAGGTPPSKVRLFDNSRLLILRQGDELPDYQVYGPSDLDEPSGNYAGKDLKVTLDGGFVRAFQVLGWTNRSLGPTWNGKVEIVRVRDEIQAFTTRAGSVVLAFKAPGNEVLQMESSPDLEKWKPLESAFPGDGNIKVQVVRMSDGENRFFRLRKFTRSIE